MIQNPRLAGRYAKSLIDIAQEQKVLDATLNDVHYLQQLLKQSTDFSNMMKSPVINASKKLSITKAVFGSNVSDLTNRFIQLLIEKGREGNLTEIAQSFQEQYDEIHHIKKVSVTTASKMDDSTRKKVSEKIASFLPGSTVEIEEHINEDLIGGFVIEMGDKLYDASVKRELNDMRKKFTSNDYIASV